MFKIFVYDPKPIFYENSRQVAPFSGGLSMIDWIFSNLGSFTCLIQQIQIEVPIAAISVNALLGIYFSMLKKHKKGNFCTQTL
jgi:hypothetical protein